MVGKVMRPAPMPITGLAPEVDREGLHPREREVTQPDFDELLGTIAHELRSPLATILSALQVIDYDRDMDPATRRALAVMERQSRQAMQIIEDLFDLVASSWGKL